MTTAVLAYRDPFAFTQDLSVKVIVSALFIVFAAGAVVTIVAMFSRHGGIGTAVVTAVGVIVVACLVGGGMGIYSIVAQYLKSQGVDTVVVRPPNPYGR